MTQARADISSECSPTPHILRFRCGGDGLGEEESTNTSRASGDNLAELRGDEDAESVEPGGYAAGVSCSPRQCLGRIPSTSTRSDEDATWWTERGGQHADKFRHANGDGADGRADVRAMAFEGGGDGSMLGTVNDGTVRDPLGVPRIGVGRGVGVCERSPNSDRQQRSVVCVAGGATIYSATEGNLRGIEDIGGALGDGNLHGDGLCDLASGCGGARDRPVDPFLQGPPAAARASPRHISASQQENGGLPAQGGVHVDGETCPPRACGGPAGGGSLQSSGERERGPLRSSGDLGGTSSAETREEEQAKDGVLGEVGGIQCGVGGGVPSRSWAGGGPFRNLGARVEPEELGGASPMETNPSTPTREGYFASSGRKHSLHLKLRGINDKGGATITGKTSQRTPRWETTSGQKSALGSGRDDTISVGLAKDLLAAQRAEFVEAQRKQSGEHKHKVLDLRLAKSKRDTLQREHEHEISALVQQQSVHHRILAEDLTTQESRLEDLAASSAAARRKHEVVLERKLTMIERRNEKIAAAENTVLELEAAGVKLKLQLASARSSIAGFMSYHNLNVLRNT